MRSWLLNPMDAAPPVTSQRLTSANRPIRLASTTRAGLAPRRVRTAVITAPAPGSNQVTTTLIPASWPGRSSAGPPRDQPARAVPQPEHRRLVPPVRDADRAAAAQVTQTVADHLVGGQPQPGRDPAPVDAGPLLELGPGEPRAQRQYPYPVPAHREPDRLAEVGDPGLARRVRRAGHGYEPGDRGDIDHIALAPFHHAGQRRAGQPLYRCHVERQHPVQVVRRGLEEGPVQGHAGRPGPEDGAPRDSGAAADPRGAARHGGTAQVG